MCAARFLLPLSIPQSGCALWFSTVSIWSDSLMPMEARWITINSVA